MAGIVVAVVLGPGAASAGAAELVSTTTTVPNTGATQDGRFAPDATPSGCGTLDFSPTLTNAGTGFHFRNHTFRSNLTDPVCVTVNVTTACAGMNAIFSVGYVGVFNPADPLENYAGDLGSTGSGTYSFAPPGGSPFAIVVHEVSSGAGCAGYTLTVTSDGPWANSAPAIFGNAPAVGAVITGSNAAWATNPAPPTVERRWRRCDAAGANCVDIPGATTATYTVTDADVGSTLRFRNIATDVDGTNTSDSTPVEPFIPFETHPAESLGPGDRVQSGIFVRTGLEAHCASPSSPPTVLQPASSFLYDVFPVATILNEPVCLIARTLPGCGLGVSPSIYSPVFAPASGLATNYAANSGVAFAQAATTSATLPPGGAREVTVAFGSAAGSCSQYSLTLGTDAPFALARPAVDGTPAEGATLTTSDGTWSGTPSLTYSWLSCNADGAECSAIAGANAAAYVPAAADAGRRLRARVTATQGRSVSVDSQPTGSVVPAPPASGGPDVPPVVPTVVDRTAPKARIALSRATLEKVLKRGYIVVNVTCDEASAITLRAEVASKLRRLLGRNIATGKGTCRAGKRAAVKVKVTRKARKALRSSNSVAFTLMGTAADAAGNRAAVATKARLKRQRKR